MYAYMLFLSVMPVWLCGYHHSALSKVVLVGVAIFFAFDLFFVFCFPRKVYVVGPLTKRVGCACHSFDSSVTGVASFYFNLLLCTACTIQYTRFVIVGSLYYQCYASFE